MKLIETMTEKQVLGLFDIDDLRHLPESIMSLLEGDVEKRDKIYKELIELNNYDMSFDWFSEIYETDLAQRKKNGQDFTPKSVAKLCSLLTGTSEGMVHEPTAGNGSMLIADWWEKRKIRLPWEYFPSRHMINCWELSSRALPILLLNLSIRGMMGYVYHGDVLTMEIKAKYILLNRKDNTLAFSEIIKDVNNNLSIREKKNETERNNTVMG